MNLDWIAISTRWVHIIAAVIAVGGAVFIRFVLHPTTLTLPPDTVESFRANIRRRWAMLFMLCIALLLISGLYNYMAVSIPNHRGQPLYHALFGVKFILAMVIFFIGSALVGRSPALEPLRRNLPRWLGINILLAAIVIALACTLKFIPTATAH